MRMKTIATAVSAAALALAIWTSPASVQAQPLFDRIHVNLPYKIVLGEKTLEPGEYTIQRLPDNGGARILLFYTDNGMKFETSAMTIPALDINTARDTKLILNHVADSYYIHKIWVQGKDYGYELPIPKSLKLRETEQMTQTTVAAKSEETTKTETAETKTEVTETATTAVVTTPPPVTAETDVKVSEETRKTEVTQPVEVQPVTPVVTESEANRVTETPAPAPAMPNTAANWLMMLLSGGTLSGAGLMLRRKR